MRTLTKRQARAASPSRSAWAVSDLEQPGFSCEASVSIDVALVCGDGPLALGGEAFVFEFVAEDAKTVLRTAL
jgi:hypothetical protein